MIELSKALLYYIRGLGELLGAEGVTVYVPAPTNAASEPLLLHSAGVPAVSGLDGAAAAASLVASLEKTVGADPTVHGLPGLVPTPDPDAVLISLEAVDRARREAEQAAQGRSRRRIDKEKEPPNSAAGAWLGVKLPSGRGSAAERIVAALSPGSKLPPAATAGRWLEWLLSMGGALTGQTLPAIANSADAISGLPGRLQFHNVLAERLSTARRTGRPLGLLLINPDDFVAVNDRLGKAAGDRCVREIGAGLRGALREGDLVVRYGGVVFAAVLDDCSIDYAGRVAGRFVDELASIGYFGGEVKLGFSIGYSVLDPVEGEDSHSTELVQRADRALSAAKRLGGGRAVGWEELSDADRVESFDRMSGMFTGNMSQDYRNMVLLWDAVNVIALKPDSEELVSRIVEMLFDTFRPVKVGVFALSSRRRVELLGGLTRQTRLRGRQDRLRILELRREQFEFLFKSIRDGVAGEMTFSPAAGEGVDGEPERRSYAVPLRVGADCLGSIYIEGRRDTLDFDSTDLIFFRALASQVAVAMDRARQADLQTDRADSERRQLKRELNSLRRAFERGRLIYRSAKMEVLVESARRAASSDATVLITGGSGTGKELLARTIHDLSPRSKEPVVVVDCGAVPPHLIESELFGCERDNLAAVPERSIGRLAEAHRGSVLLDEVGELPIEVQSRLLRFVQERRIIPVGGGRSREVDVRVLAASTRDLAEEVRAGRFREDLFFRLDVIRLEVPLLRDRPDDILILARHFLERARVRYGKRVDGFSVSAERALITHPWPGNVRELQNRVLQAAILSSADEVQVEELGLHANGDGELGPEAASSSATNSLEVTLGLLGSTLARLLQAQPSEKRGGLPPLGRWLSEELLIAASEEAPSLAAGALIVGIPESTFRRRLSKARLRIASERVGRPAGWDGTIELLSRLLKIEKGEGVDLMAEVEATLVREVVTLFPGNVGAGSRVLGVSPPTFRRRVAALDLLDS